MSVKGNMSQQKLVGKVTPMRNIDRSLTRDGYAADARVTGEALEARVKKAELLGLLSGLEVSEEGININFKKDWSVNDETSPRFIHGRTHYEKDGVVKQLDDKFIPDTICRKDYVDQLLGANVAEVASLVGGDA